MRVLVTGGYGFIGSYAADFFSSEGHEVYIIDDLSNGDAQAVENKHVFYHLKIEDRQCEKIFQVHNFDVVIHLASQTQTSESVTHYDLAQSNLLGLTNMMNLSAQYGVRMFMYVSSAEEYGHCDLLPVNELSDYNLATLHSIQQWIGEQYCLKWMEQDQLTTLCLRLPDVYGPRLPGTAVIGTPAEFIERIITSDEAVYGDGRQKIDLLYVEDAAEAIYHCVIHRLSGVYNLSSNVETSLYEISSELKKIGATTSFIHKPSAEDAPHRKMLKNDKLMNVLDWSPVYNLQEGLSKTFEHFKRQSTPQAKKSKPLLDIPQLKQFYKTGLSLLSHLCLFTLMYVLKVQLIDTLYMVDFQLIYIIIATFIFGRYESMLAIGLGSIWFIRDSISNGRELISLFADHHTLVHLGLYLFAGLILAYVLGLKDQKLKDVQEEALKTKEQHETLLTSYHNVIAIKNELRNQVLYANESFGTIYDIMKNLDFIEPARTFTTAISVCEKVMKASKVAIYIIDQKENQTQLNLAACSENLLVQPHLSVADHPILSELEETRTVVVNKKIKANQPFVVAPIVIEGTLIGAICLFADQFEQVTMFDRNLFSITANLIAMALQSAYKHQDARQHQYKGIKISNYVKEKAYV